MLVLLSSSKRKRYREDILRCMATPIGATIQFRYSKEIVDSNIWKKSHTFIGKEGMVCSVNLDMIQVPCELVSIRKVTIKSIEITGSTMTVLLTTGAFVYSENPENLTQEIHQKSGGQVPIMGESSNDADSNTGNFFFEVSEEVTTTVENPTIENWQNITAKLITQPGYESEEFFWTLMDLKKSTDERNYNPSFLSDWDRSVELEQDQTVRVHVYHPNKDKWEPKSGYKLKLSSSSELISSYPMDVAIDSPYDVKRWKFFIKGTQTWSATKSWLRIGPEHDGKVEWEIDLPLTIKASKVKIALNSLIIGFLIAVPGLVAITTNVSLDTNQKMWLGSLSVIAGVVAALYSKMGMKKTI